MNKIYRTIAACLAVALLGFVWSCGKKQPETELEFLLDWKMAPTYAPYVLGVQNGYYKKEGLVVRIVEGQGAETSAKLIGSGKYQIGTCNAAATAIAVDNHIPIRSVAVVDQQAVTAVFSLADSNIRTPGDLVGKKLGVRYYDISHKEYLAMMKAAGIDTKAVTEISVGFDLQPLLERQVDALYNYAYNMPVQAAIKGISVRSILVKDNGVKGIGSNIIANNDFIKNHPDLIKKFIRATQRAWLDSIANPQAAVDALRAKNPEIDAQFALASLKEQFKWVQQDGLEPLSQQHNRWQEALAQYLSLGLIKSPIAVDEVYINVNQDER